MKRPKNPRGGLPEWVIACRIQNSRAERLRKEAGIPKHVISAARPVLKYKKRPGDSELIARFSSLIKLARPTPFEIEGTLVAALRSAQCVTGMNYPSADFFARAIVGESYRSIGAKRPNPDEGQRYYTRTNCAYCHSYLDGGESVFCDDHCAVLAKARNIREESFAQYAWNRQAHRAIQRQKIEARHCEAPGCGREFVPRTPKARLCHEHRDSERATAIPKKLCATCGEPFRGKTRGALYCSRSCNPVTHRKIDDRACQNPTCRRYFRPQNNERVYCSMLCYREGSRGKLKRAA